MIAPYMHHLAASRKQTCAQGGGPGPGEFWVPGPPGGGGPD